MVKPVGPVATGPQRWTLTPAARTAVTRIGLLLMLLICIDGALTWRATDEAAAVVAAIVERDGFVTTDEFDGGDLHRTEIERAVGQRGDRLRRAELTWIPAVAIALLAGLVSTRADPALRRTVVMAVALTLAIWLAPRVVYSRELPVLDSVFG